MRNIGNSLEIPSHPLARTPHTLDGIMNAIAPPTCAVHPLPCTLYRAPLLPSNVNFFVYFKKNQYICRCFVERRKKMRVLGTTLLQTNEQNN
jgi:hypothetical protein